MFNYELKVKLWNSKQQVTNRLQSSFFHAMGVTGESSLPVAEKMAKKFYCVMTTSTVYKDCTKQFATLTTDENGNTDVAEVTAGTVYAYYC